MSTKPQALSITEPQADLRRQSGHATGRVALALSVVGLVLAALSWSSIALDRANGHLPSVLNDTVGVLLTAAPFVGIVLALVGACLGGGLVIAKREALRPAAWALLLGLLGFLLAAAYVIATIVFLGLAWSNLAPPD